MSESIEKRVEGLSKQDAGMGKLSAAQGIMSNIQSEQLSNLQQHRTIATQEALSNQNLSQVAQLVAGSSPDVPSLDVNPATQALLSKYGYGQPKFVNNASRRTSNAPGNVVVNNNVENKTTNQITMSTPNIPMKAQGPGMMEKFQAWLSNVFAKQNEQANLRERAYQKREWSLSRSANKMMREIEGLGKDMAASMDPRKVGAMYTDQIKTLLIFFGLHKLTTNWDVFTKGLTGVEAWVKSTASYFTEKKEGGRTEFVGDVISFFGGDKDDMSKGVFDVIRDTFVTGDNSVVNLITQKFRDMGKERADAIKAVPFPDLDLSSIVNTVSGLGTYLGDILKCLAGGKDGLASSISNKIQKTGKDAALDNGGDRIRGKDKKWIGYNLELGDAAAVNGSKVSMKPTDYESDDLLAPGPGATVRMGNTLNSMLNSDSKVVPTSAIASGITTLQKSAVVNNGITVGDSFFSFLSGLGIDIDKSKVAKKRYKYVAVDKTEEEIGKDNGGDVAYAAGEAYLERDLRNKGIDWVKEESPWYTGGIPGTLADMSDTYITGDVIKNPGWQATKAGMKALVNRKLAADKKLVLVPEDDPREGYNLGKGYDSVVELSQLSASDVNSIVSLIEQKLFVNPGEFGTDNGIAMRSLNDALTKYKTKLHTEKWNAGEKGDGWGRDLNKHTQSFTSDVDMDVFKPLDRVTAVSEARSKTLSDRYEASPIKTTIDNTVEAAKSAGKWAINTATSLVSSAGYDVGSGNTFKITDKVSRERIGRAMNMLMEKFNLSDVQAAGIVGNLFFESGGLNHTAYNGEGGNYGAQGLAQWRGPRVEAFKKMFGKLPVDATFEEQLEFVQHELEGSHKAAINRLQGIMSTDQAADIGLGHYEFMAGFEGAMADLERHGHKASRRAQQGRDSAASVLKVFRELEKGVEPSEVAASSSQIQTPTQEVTAGISVNSGYGVSNVGVNNFSPLDPAQFQPTYTYSSTVDSAVENIKSSSSGSAIANKVDEIAGELRGQSDTLILLAQSIDNLAEVAIRTGNTSVVNNSTVTNTSESYTGAQSPWNNLGS